VGLEADIQGALERETNNWGQTFSFDHLVNANSTGAVATTYTTQIDWFGTVRARIGYLWGDGAVLTYVTGGLAYGEVKINGTSTVSGGVAVRTILGWRSHHSMFGAALADHAK
jgi:outer membrane immunogenic protein